LDVGRHSKFMLIDWLIDWLFLRRVLPFRAVAVYKLVMDVYRARQSHWWFNWNVVVIGARCTCRRGELQYIPSTSLVRRWGLNCSAVKSAMTRPRLPTSLATSRFHSFFSATGYITRYYICWRIITTFHHDVTDQHLFNCLAYVCDITYNVRSAHCPLVGTCATILVDHMTRCTRCTHTSISGQQFTNIAYKLIRV